MRWMDQYRAKLKSPQEAVKLVKDGDWVDYGSNNSFPHVLDRALAGRKEELGKVYVRGNLIQGPIMVMEEDPEMETFIYQTWHCSAYERKKADQGRAFFIPQIFRNEAWYIKNFLDIDVAMLSVTPMDKHGYFNLSCGVGTARSIVDKAKVVIVEVVENIPKILGGMGTTVHISEVDAVVEAGNQPLWIMDPPHPSETDTKIAELILPHIVNGATLQLGIGGMPNALGSLIAESDIQDLGMHTELCSDGYLNLYQAGKITNAKKKVVPGRGVLGMLFGTQDLYDWADDNQGLAGYPLDWVNDPNIAGANDNLISINGCIKVDLYGQVSSETVGFRQISGTGGQLDFVDAASRSKGGKSFLCLASSKKDKEGKLHSNIVPYFQGDIVTTPRTQSYFIVTEYGAVNLSGLSTWQRAEALISIAHPDLREDLIESAKKQKIWLPSNKR